MSLGVAIVGLGVGEQHLRAYLATGRCAIRWLYDLDRARAEATVQRYGQGAAAGSLDQVLEDPAVQVVSVASFDDAHAAQVEACLKAGRHVFVEKPLCRTFEELRRIRAAWGRYNGRLKLRSNLVLRSAPLYRWLRARVQDGELGALYSFDGDYLYGRLQKITEGWRGAVEGYSVMLGGGIHLVDLMLWLTGQRPEAVSAAGGRLCTEGTRFRYEDYVAATFQFRSGLVGRVSANFGCVHPHQHVVRVFGTSATFLYDDAGPRLQRSREEGARAEPVTLAPLPAGKGDLIPDFVSAVEEDRDLTAETQAAFDAVSACLAADGALRSGRPNRIEYA